MLLLCHRSNMTNGRGQGKGQTGMQEMPLEFYTTLISAPSQKQDTNKQTRHKLTDQILPRFPCDSQISPLCCCPAANTTTASTMRLSTLLLAGFLGIATGYYAFNEPLRVRAAAAIPKAHDRSLLPPRSTHSHTFAAAAMLPCNYAPRTNNQTGGGREAACAA